MILTWQERCEKFDDGEIVTNAKIQQMMQEEIDELREALKLRELSDEEIDNIFGICALNPTVTLTTEQCYWVVDAILKKASEK